MPVGNMNFEMKPVDKGKFYEQLDLLDAQVEADDDLVHDDLRRQSRAFFQQTKQHNKNPPRSSRLVDSDKTIPIPSMAKDPATTTSENLMIYDLTAVASLTPTTVNSTPFAPSKDNQTHRPHIPISTSFVQDTPLQPPQPVVSTSLRRSLTEPTARLPEQSSPVMSSASTRKRNVKGKKKDAAVPEERQILRGLSLFYIRSDRVGLKRQRMEHAEKYGAVVTDKLSAATHVVVDQDLKYDDIKDAIALNPGQALYQIVKEQWPLDCIQQGRLLSANPRYRVRGMPTADDGKISGRKQEENSVQPGEASVMQVSDVSLKLKSPADNKKRWDFIPDQTPSQDTPPLPFTSRDPGIAAIISQQSPTTRTAEQGAATALLDNHEEAHADTYQNPEASLRESSVFGDELSQVMNEVHEHFKDLPPIGEDDAVLSPGEEGQEDDSDTADENEKKKAKTGPKPKRKKTMNEEHFACNRGGTIDQSSDQANPNAPTIAVFKQMLEYYTQTNDYWRILAYRKCIGTLSKITDRKITTAEEAMELPWFGKRLSTKLEEIVKTHTLARLTYALSDPASRVLALFLGIYGVGNTTAARWVARGFRTLEDLRERADLTDAQRVGIDHYDDLNARIPRAEVARLAACVRAEAARVDAAVELLVGGSYRRGADSSGDVDLIITRPGTTSSGDLVPFLERLVLGLERRGFLTAALASSSFHHGGGSGGGGSKWHGCCVLPRIPGFNDDGGYRPVWRRIDLLLVPETEYGAALIYFTGNDIFNRSIRLLASRKGMRLNQRGLYKDALRGLNRQKVAEGELLEGRSEKKIFQILGVKWRAPEERWC